jgi:hypothetical protein
MRGFLAGVLLGLTIGAGAMSEADKKTNECKPTAAARLFATQRQEAAKRAAIVIADQNCPGVFEMVYAAHQDRGALDYWRLVVGLRDGLEQQQYQSALLHLEDEYKLYDRAIKTACGE